MSNESSSSMPWFRGDDYITVLEATPPEDSTPEGSLPDFFCSPNRTFVLHVNRPSPRQPRPITPIFEQGIPLDLSPCGQRIVFSPWSPPAMDEPSFEYPEMTQSGDSGYATYRGSQIDGNNLYRALSPIMSSSSSSYLPQLPQMDEWFQSLSPVQPVYLDPTSPDMFPPASPGSYALNVIRGLEFSPSPPRQSQMDEWLRSLTPISQRTLLNTTRRENSTDWADDGYDDILVIHMITHEEEWGKDGADGDLNRHMDAYEKMNY